MCRNTKPLATVIVLTYNNFVHIRETIISILRQNYPYIEMIISDDCSKCFPKELVNDCINKNCKSNLVNYQIIINESNIGTVKNLNNAIKSCHGEIVFTIGANDMFINQDSITNVVDIFLQNNCDAIFTSRIVYNKDKIHAVLPHVVDWEKIHKLKTKMSIYTAFITTKHYNIFIGVTTVYKRTVIETNNYFDENYRLLEDMPMTEKIIWNNNIILCPELVTILYDGKYGVSSRGKTNPILANDLSFFNQYGKLIHYNSLSKKAKRHIDFGILRSKKKSIICMLLSCFRYAPTIISWEYYCISRLFASYKDKKLIKSIILDDYKSFLS